MVWEERWHPLREEWVIIAAHRQRRPWVGERLPSEVPAAASFDAHCTLCPGNARISGAVNPAYEGIFTFDNDHPCVGPEASPPGPEPETLFRNRSASGLARVVCYTPVHGTTLAQQSVGEIEALLAEWQHQYLDLGRRPEVVHVLTFENKGEVVGVSNPHPHCQIYATNFIFRNTEVELRASERHHRETGRFLFVDLLESELRDGRRVLGEFDTAVSFVPYFARYAYETFVAPRAVRPSIADLLDEERRDLARALKDTLVRLDNLWRIDMPYVMALHQAPTTGRSGSPFHFHIEIHPPLRMPGVRKYLAGCEEGGGNFLSDTSPEEKAAELRELSPRHFRESGS